MKRTRKPTWSFVVMRGADKSVKQFSVSKRSVFVAPMAAILAVTGCVAGLQMKAAYELKHLEENLNSQSAHFTQTITGMDKVIAGKDEAIVSLQQEILALSHQAKEMKDKMDELSRLEIQLQQFIEKYGGSVTGTSSSATTDMKRGTVRALSSTTDVKSEITRTLSATTDVNRVTYRTLSATSRGISPSVHSTSPNNIMQIASLAQSTSLDLQALSDMVDAMEISMEQTLKQAQDKRMTIDAVPSHWPTRSKQLTSSFGYRKDPFTGSARFHAGIDINGNSGDAVFSAADGTIIEVGYDSQHGNFIIISHLGGLQTAYMHLKQIDAKEGDIVVRGEKIGQLGSSGRSTGPHLHFQIMQKNEPVNPLKYLAQHS